MAFLVLLAAVIVAVAMAVRLRSKSPNHPACGRCGYDVTATVGHSDRCPECGALFIEVGIVPPAGPTAERRATSKVVVVVLVVATLLSSILALGGIFAARASVASARAQALAAQQRAAAQAQAQADQAARANRGDAESVTEPRPEPRGEAP